MIQSGVADIVGGAQVDSALRWAAGCYQMAQSPYTIRLQEGYYRSGTSCSFCQYLDGPFLLRIPDFLKIEAENAGMKFHRLAFFVAAEKLGLRSMTCPDSLYHGGKHLFDIENAGILKSSLTQIAKIFHVCRFELKFASVIKTLDVKFTCEEADLKYGTHKGFLTPPCCIGVLSSCLDNTIEILKKHKIPHAVAGGTILGPAKFQRTMPWELDHDIRILDASAERVFDLKGELAALKLELQPQNGFNRTEVHDCVRKGKHAHCSYFHVQCGKWYAELYGVRDLTADGATPRENLHLPSVKVSHNGHWIQTFTVNPGKYLRIMYTDDYFSHAEHPSKFSKGAEGLSSGHFAACQTPGFQGCADTMRPYGSLPFQDIYKGY